MRRDLSGTRPLPSGLDLGLLARTLEGREPDPASAHATDQRRQADAALLVHATLTHEPLEPLAAASDAAEEATGGAPAGAESPSAGAYSPSLSYHAASTHCPSIVTAGARRPVWYRARLALGCRR